MDNSSRFTTNVMEQEEEQEQDKLLQILPTLTKGTKVFAEQPQLHRVCYLFLQVFFLTTIFTESAPLGRQSVCVCVCVSVCLSVCLSVPAGAFFFQASHNQFHAFHWSSPHSWTGKKDPAPKKWLDPLQKKLVWQKKNWTPSKKKVLDCQRK